ncbi:tetratricopeptide repeat protein [Oscillatoria acuminata]|uniref:Uncharacterized protein n=1 Tax=Oscillatoria acuminata PCC 6304 TaxID=56110 RepID=K9TRN3_9CYAN|nr:tetratricopeptide repeat protein [Oscillatoria acuminata]AFY85073.1 hypothetical protein Oscil6304_5590 [Oscillatoria acuminata PCC 6304]
MQTLRIQLQEVQRDCVELRYRVETQKTYESQILSIAEIANLVKESKRDYYIGRPRLKEMGQKLFCWLDGDGRWLSRAIAQCDLGGLILAIATPEKLAHLPWELLHDGTSFLVEGLYPMVVPVRWIDKNTPPPSTLKARPLQVLFMATSPETVEPVLDFEAEEARILAQTQDMAVQVRVEESGCVAELGKLWKRYPPQTFDIFHLTGHGKIQQQTPYDPYFITETETGEPHDTSASELAEVFFDRWPQLIFLSGCRTGQAGNQGAVLSMAETLIHQGAPAVLGWGLEVLETTATAAAAHLYQELAAGYSLGKALGSTYRYLLQKQGVEDWHLLRLYVRGDCPGALVEPPGDYYWQPPQLPQEQFLDPLTQEVRVATREEFVGRRRYLQRYLRALKGGKFLGVLIHGIGGVGKSTVGARLLERMPEYEPIFIYRGLDEAKLINQLSRQCTNETGSEIWQEKLSLMQRLTKFLRMGLNDPKQQLMFVLDDFEANMEPRSDGKRMLKSEVVEVVQGLLDAIAQSRGPHRVIITCRYDFTLDPTLNRRLDREPLAALRGADLRKKCQRLASFQPDSELDANLQEQAKNAADGNPRLLEWLNQILLTPSVAISEITTKIQEVEAEFRADILAEELLNQQDKDLREMLRLGLVFQVPVPRAAFTAICSKIRNLETHITRAISLGLLESIQSTPADGELLRVPRLLPLPVPENDEPLHRQAADLLYRIWWEESETPTEERLIEIHRLALVGKAGEVAAKIGHILSNTWIHQSRYKEALKMCQDTLAVVKDYRIFHQMGISEQQLGEVETASEHYQQALDLCPLEDKREKALIVHNLATFKAKQGEIDQAIALSTESMELFERIGSTLEGKVATLHHLAGIKAKQGEIDEAIALYTQSLEINERIGHLQGKAATLHELAGIKTNQGEIKEAIALYTESLEIDERIGHLEGKAATLHHLAGIKADQGEIKEAIALYTQSLEINERIGILEGKAATLHCLAIIKAKQGEIDEAIALYTESIELEERIGNLEGKAETLYQLATIKTNQGEMGKAIILYTEWLHCLAIIKAKQGEIDEAIALYNKSMELNELIGDVQVKAAILHQLAIITANQGEIDEAIALYNKSMELNELIGNLQGKAATLHQLASIKANQGEIDEAIAFYTQSMELDECIGDVQGKAATLIMLGQLLAIRGDFTTALQYMHESLDILERLRSPEAEKVREIIAQMQKKAEK